ncbi:hypothetical protein BDV29DRAFT_158675 [Aspergillus leporis]|uniref:Uncharacterized protein n=1 Tax=Aspergillus leporis TaxID=41062 RepID=A0A5N5WUS8_9EURO|nr:hypothetical protein BDV29DRAFT_158675 [Aspergillus leporis]
MGFGSPGTGVNPTKPTPPERGSFPLDHEGMNKFLTAVISNDLPDSRTRLSV